MPNETAAALLPAAVPSATLNTGARIPRLGFGTYLANGDDLYDALLFAFKVVAGGPTKAALKANSSASYRSSPFAR